jgi:PhnB protein
MNNVTLDAYIFFKEGKCKEGMAFYKSVFGGETHFQTYEEGGMGMPEGAEAGMIMHSTLRGGLTDLMGSDSTTPDPFGRSAITLSLSGMNDEALRDVFAKLSEGGKVDQELMPMPWGDTFGGVTDKYGIEWMVDIMPAKSEEAEA